MNNEENVVKQNCLITLEIQLSSLKRKPEIKWKKLKHFKTNKKAKTKTAKQLNVLLYIW